MAPKVPVAVAQSTADAVGGNLGALIVRAAQGTNQTCPWELVTVKATTSEARAAAVWVVADAIMAGRTGLDTDSYRLWRQATLSGTPLSETDRSIVHGYAYPVFDAAGREQKPGRKYHGLEGYVSEWLWYLTLKETPLKAGESVEFLSSPGPTSTDSGGDGIVIHRFQNSSTSLIFRLWEMKKFTSEKSDDVGPTIRNAVKQLHDNGAIYLAAFSWADKHLAADTRVFVSTLPRQWAKAETTSNAGVSVTVDSAPPKAFHTAHKHLPTHTHAGALCGRIVAIDNFESFAKDVREYVWTAL
ncbi:hypothetical protein ABTX77_38945 [Streptomyces sp. NPDC097704]|uniref:hypothetical protein n=1 Tax=Streptomyces sp. NPDC097704 TaxID=3157101 RepID=UPI00331D3F43